MSKRTGIEVFEIKLNRLRVLGLVLMLTAACGGEAGPSREKAVGPAQVEGAMEVRGALERRFELDSSRHDPIVREGTETIQLTFRGDDAEWPGARLYLIGLPLDLDVAAYALENSEFSADLHFTPADMIDNTDRFSPQKGVLAIERIADGEISGRFAFEAEENSFKPREQRRRIEVEVTFEGVPLVRP